MNDSIAMNDVDLVERPPAKRINYMRLAAAMVQCFHEMSRGTAWAASTNHVNPQSTQRVHRTQRAHRSATKRAKPSGGSSDSDGGPGSDSSDRRTLFRTPYHIRSSSNSLATPGIPISAHFIYSYARHGLCAFLSWLAISNFSPILTRMNTSFQGGNHV